MKQIPLTRGYVALVDDEDYEKLSKHKWFAYKHRHVFYAARNVQITPGYGGNRLIRMHYDVVGRAPKPLVTDHIDGNGLNNQKSNLRFVTNRRNCLNKHVKNSSKYPGVQYKKRTKSSKRWIARITTRQRIIVIGYYLTEEEAYEAHKNYLRIVELAEKYPLKACCE